MLLLSQGLVCDQGRGFLHSHPGDSLYLSLNFEFSGSCVSVLKKKKEREKETKKQRKKEREEKEKNGGIVLLLDRQMMTN